MKLKSTLSSATRVFFAVAMAVILLPLQAQNLVPNPSFENMPAEKMELKEDGKLGKEFKYEGMVKTHTNGWMSATMVAPDLYYDTGISCEEKGEKTKATKASAPCNAKGYQEVKDGDFYAGFRAYSKGNPKLKRSYLQIELSQLLEANQMYCVSFDISLSEMSRYAVDNIGALFSDRKIDTGKDYPLDDTPSVRHKDNKVMMDQIGWETVCGTYVGEGEEKYLIVGAFGADVDMEVEKIKARPQDPSECPNCLQGSVQAEAYYFIDNIKVEPISALSQCKCGGADERDMNFVYGTSVNLPEDATAEQRVNNAAIYYAYLRKSPTGAGQKTVEELVQLLTENPDMNVEIVGHCDSDEFDEGTVNYKYKEIGLKRATMVKRQLEAQGIASERLSVVGAENNDPADTRMTKIAKARNRRVVFSVK